MSRETEQLGRAMLAAHHVQVKISSATVLVRNDLS